MIPISSAWCLRCGHRYDSMPERCNRPVLIEGVEQRCPGWVIQFLVDTAPPTMVGRQAA